MLEIILIVCMVFLILTFFYKQAVCDFRINQIEWSQKDNISSLLIEKVPIVVRSIPSATFWTHNDVIHRACYTNIPIFKETSLVDWLSTSNVDSICPWKYEQAEMIAAVSSINIWADRYMNYLFNSYIKFWIYPKYHCWAGNIGLRKTYAPWTCFFPVDGDITFTILPENNQSSLPANWLDCFPANFTINDTPFVGDLKFIDVILRPGTCIFMPSHWFVSWTCKSTVASMVCSISYHTPISLLAFTTVK